MRYSRIIGTSSSRAILVGLLVGTSLVTPTTATPTTAPTFATTAAPTAADPNAAAPISITTAAPTIAAPTIAAPTLPITTAAPTIAATTLPITTAAPTPAATTLPTPPGSPPNQPGVLRKEVNVGSGYIVGPTSTGNNSCTDIVVTAGSAASNVDLGEMHWHLDCAPSDLSDTQDTQGTMFYTSGSLDVTYMDAGTFTPTVLSTCQLTMEADLVDGWKGSTWNGLGLCGVSFESSTFSFESSTLVFVVAPSLEAPPSPPTLPPPSPPPPSPHVPPISPSSSAGGKNGAQVAVPALTVTLLLSSSMTITIQQIVSVRDAMSSYANCSTYPRCTCEFLHGLPSLADPIDQLPLLSIYWTDAYESGGVFLSDPASTAARDAFEVTLESYDTSRRRLLSGSGSLMARLVLNGMDGSVSVEDEAGVASYQLTRELQLPPTLPPPSPPPPSAPPNPPPPSPPPSPPPTSPPASPGYCVDTCNGGTPNNVCDDGGPLRDGTENPDTVGTCTVGTDCTDCGVRAQCTACKASCQERNNKLFTASGIKNTCFDHFENNGVCDSNCNNLECGHDEDRSGSSECSAIQIEALCVPAMDVSKANIASAPQTAKQTTSTGEDGTSTKVLVPGSLYLDLNQARLQLYDVISEWTLLFGMTYTLEWRDHRIATSECARVVEGMVSMVPEEALSDIERAKTRANRRFYWVPDLAVENLVPDFDLWADETTFKLSKGNLDSTGAAAYNATGDPRSLSYLAELPAGDDTGWVSFAGEIEPIIQQEHFDYSSYPFDKQVLTTVFAVPDLDIQNCEGGGASTTGPLSRMGITDDESATDALLPANNEWRLDGSYDTAVSFTRLISKGDFYMGERCQMEIKIKRNPIVFSVKNIGMTVRSGRSDHAHLTSTPHPITHVPHVIARASHCNTRFEWHPWFDLSPIWLTPP